MIGSGVDVTLRLEGEFNSEANKGLRLTTPLASRLGGTRDLCVGDGIDRVEHVDRVERGVGILTTDYTD